MDETVRCASLKRRILAFLLDYFIIAAYGLIVIGTLSALLHSFFRPLFAGSAAIAELTGFLLMTLPVALYFLICECAPWQGTWGKRRLALQVVDRCGRRIGPVRSAVRTVAKFIPWETAHFAVWQILLPGPVPERTAVTLLILVHIMAAIYLFSQLTNRERRSVYDWIAGTRVIVRISPSRDTVNFLAERR
ncbi:RDD family protein [Sporolactobacillus vineae]|uniref:RDD family protein n=1 Tax=Sporolactobacillus vineae TaxID=444463 RepID=UPI0002884AD4|nr:RDD family protein [Sporolactobacillus vineae]